MKYYKRDNTGQLDTTGLGIDDKVNIIGNTVFIATDGQFKKDTWEEITQNEYVTACGAFLPASKPPDAVTLLGQFMVEQMLTNAELSQKIDAIGQGVVELQLKGMGEI